MCPLDLDPRGVEQRYLSQHGPLAELNDGSVVTIAVVVAEEAGRRSNETFECRFTSVSSIILDSLRPITQQKCNIRKK